MLDILENQEELSDDDEVELSEHFTDEDINYQNSEIVCNGNNEEESLKFKVDQQMLHINEQNSLIKSLEEKLKENSQNNANLQNKLDSV